MKGKYDIVVEKLEDVDGKIEALNEEYEKIVYNKNQKVTKKSKCDHCEETFLSPLEVEKHMKYLQQEKKFKCDQCSKTFYLEWRLKKHMKGHLRTSTRKCHFFNNNKLCPFDEYGCKFEHVVSEECLLGTRCQMKMCQYRH